jgi:hypothetical protein
MAPFTVLLLALLQVSASGLHAPNAAVLRNIPGVASVTVHAAKSGPAHRIIHIRDWHFVRLPDFAADLRAVGKLLSDDAIASRYEKFLTEVESVQAEQRQLLAHLIQQHGLKQVYIEGLTREELPAFRQRIERLRKFEQHKPKGKTAIEELILHEHRLDRLEIGAAGQLYLAGELAEVAHAEDAEAYRAANPVREYGAVVYDDERNEAREDAIVRELLKRPIALIVLGGDHDLADNAERLSDGACETVTVATKAYRIVAEQSAGN